MQIAIAGAHGQVGRRLTRLLVAAGHRVTGIIRAEDQADDVRRNGAQPAVVDLEHADVAHVAAAIAGCGAVVFAAGAGPGSGAARKDTVDYGAAAKMIAACESAGVARYVMVSSMGAGDPPDGDDVFSVYLRAKARADAALADSNLDWTIVRPGQLTDEAGTGRVSLGAHVGRGPIPRDDVAGVIAGVLESQSTIGTTFEVITGDVPIEQALRRA